MQYLQDFFERMEATVVGIDGEVHFAHGGENADANHSPNTIVMWATSESFSAPQQPARDVTRTPGRVILTRNVQLLAKLWGQDQRQAEDLLRLVVTAMRRIGTGFSMEVTSAEWAKPESLVKHGEALMASFVVRLALDEYPPKGVRAEPVITREIAEP